jgi:hypothetical protein
MNKILWFIVGIILCVCFYNLFFGNCTEKFSLDQKNILFWKKIITKKIFRDIIIFKDQLIALDNDGKVIAYKYIIKNK